MAVHIFKIHFLLPLLLPIPILNTEHADKSKLLSFIPFRCTVYFVRFNFHTIPVL